MIYLSFFSLLIKKLNCLSLVLIVYVDINSNLALVFNLRFFFMCFFMGEASFLLALMAP